MHLGRTTSRRRLYHRSIYKYLDTWLPSLNVANGDPFKLTSPAQHASRWRMRGSQTCRLLCLCCQLAGCQGDAILRGTGVYARKFLNEITRAMHAGQERWVWRARRLAANAAPVGCTLQHSCYSPPVNERSLQSSSQTLSWTTVDVQCLFRFISVLCRVTNHFLSFA